MASHQEKGVVERREKERKMWERGVGRGTRESGVREIREIRVVEQMVGATTLGEWGGGIKHWRI